MEFTSDKINVQEFNKPQIPPTLNVLTILSIIGSVIALGSSIWQFAKAKQQYDEREEMLKKLTSEDIPQGMKNFMGDPQKLMDMIVKAYENRVPLLVVGILAAGLCLYGVLEMRKLKKVGFPIYVVGELLPFVGGIMFVGTGILSGFGIISVVIALVFIALYFFQRKNLAY